MKILNLFDDDGEIRDEFSWVLNGDGVAQALYDSTTYLNDGTSWWVRRDVATRDKHPQGFVAGAEDGRGGYAGWVPATTSDLPDPADLGPGMWQRLTDGTLVRGEDAEVLSEKTGKRTISGIHALVDQAKARGFAGVIFRAPDGDSVKVRG